MQIDKILIRILILCVPFYFVRFNIGPIPSTLLEVIIYLVFLYFLFSKKLDLSGKLKLIFPAILFLLAGLIGVLADPDVISGLGLWKAYFFDGFLVYLVVLSTKNKEEFTQTIFYSGVLVSALALILFMSSIKTLDGRLLDLDRLSPNYLAMFLVPALVLGVWQTKERFSITNLLGISLILIALYLTGSRGALVALAGSAIGYIYFYLKRKKIRWPGAALILMTVVFLVGGYAFFKPDWSDHSRKATSSNVRYYIWMTSAEIIMRNPITGVGLSNFQNYFTTLTEDRVNYPEYISPQALTAHNLYLQFFATCGIFGIVALIFLLYKSGFVSKEKAASIALFALLAYGIVDTPFFRNDLAIIFWFLLAIIYNGKKDAREA